MAGVVPKRSTSGRKQWTVHGKYDSRGCLKRLRNQLASDGCPESQVVLAKQLLDEQCDQETENKENARLGVYWLIKASEQGNIEATDLLKTCLDTGKGINELNYLDVKSCITMTQDEKLARKAAKEMFASLSNGGEYITTEQLQKKILSIDKDGRSIDDTPQENGCINHELVYGDIDDNLDDIDDEDTDWSQRSDSSNNEKLTEDHLVSAAVDYSHGHLPIVNRTLCLSDPDLKALDHIPLIQRSILHPILALKIIYYKLMRILGQQFQYFFPLAKSELQLIFLLLTYTLISSDNILYFIPMLIYYISFIVMIICTFQMLQKRREFYDFRLWSGLFICYSGGGLNATEAEFQYIRNNLKPYAIFFIALLINLIIYPIIVDQWIPQSELMIISFCLIFMTLFGFMPKKRSKIKFDLLVLLSFGINVLAKYPYETDPVVAQGWRFLDLKIPTFASYVIGNGIEFCINFRFFLYLCIPLLFIKIASNNNWRSTYEVLIPHCVTLSWLQICIISSRGATIFGLLRGSLALVGIVLFLPLVGLTSVLLPAAALTKWLLSSNILWGILLFSSLSIIGLCLYWIFAQTRYRRITAIFQIISTILSIFILLKSMNFNNIEPFTNSNGDTNLPQFLSWDVYQKFCNQPIWQEENLAVAQIKCSELGDSYIHWDGYINDIRIKSISNFWKQIIDKFPQTIQQYLYCLYGDEINDGCEQFPDLIRDECKLFYDTIRSNNYCTLNRYNVHTFEISVKMLSGIWGKSSEVFLNVDDYFKNFTLDLKPNDHIWFKGQLFNNPDGILGGTKTHIKLVEIGCLACTNQKLTTLKQPQDRCFIENLRNTFIIGGKFILNMLLSPMIVFK